MSLPKPLPDLERGALTLADLAVLEMGIATRADRTKIAIRAYLWALDHKRTIPGTDLETYPSLNDLRAALDRTRS